MKVHIRFDCRENEIIELYQNKNIQTNRKTNRKKNVEYMFIDDNPPNIIETNKNKSEEKNKISNITPKYSYTIEQLDIGDIWICEKEKDASGNYIPFLIIERKEINDYMSSIRSGRFHEQKNRLIRTIKHYNSIGYSCRGMYVIEGNLPSPSKKIRNISSSIIYSSMISTSVDNNMGIFQTKNSLGTVELVEIICKKIEKRGGIFWKNEIIKKEEDINEKNMNINLNIAKKKSYDTKLKIHTEMLTSIRGVSKDISLILLTEFNSITNIILSIRDGTFKNRAGELKQNGRRLSKKMLERIFDTFI
jgi:ERCC4-type nuclease